MKHYTCDNKECKLQETDLKTWIEIGGEKNTLFVNNNLPDRNFDQIYRFHDLHFCSSACFTEYFIKRLPQLNEDNE